MAAQATTAAATAAYQDEVNQYRWIILVGLITAAIMEVLDTTIINVALPQMAGNLGATMEEIAWVSTGYILSNVVVLPMTAFFTATFGRRNYLTASIIIFVGASFMCGTSHSLRELVMWRILQGAGGAALLSTAQATIRQIFPREQQGLVQAIFLLGIIVAPTLGPTLGGWITDNYNWGWCFFINVPIGIVAAFLVSAFLQDPPNSRRRIPIDWLGIFLLIVGLGALQYVLEEGRQNDWFNDKTILRLSVVAGFALLLLLWWQISKRNTHPVIELHVLRNRDLAGSIFLFVALGFGLYGGTFLFPLFTQNLLRFTPTETGLTLMPGGIATAITAVICGRLLSGARPLVDARILIYIGMFVFMYAMWRLGHLTTVAGEADARYPLIFRGIALGFLFTPINNAAFANVDPREAQQASGLVNLSRQLGGSFGIAILSTFLDHRVSIHRADLVSNTYAANPEFAQRQAAATAALMAHGYNAFDAHKGALELVDRMVTQQASMLAYNDSWMFLLKTFLVVSPAVLILRRPSGHGPVGDIH